MKHQLFQHRSGISHRFRAMSPAKGHRRPTQPVVLLAVTMSKAIAGIVIAVLIRWALKCVQQRQAISSWRKGRYLNYPPASRAIRPSAGSDQVFQSRQKFLKRVGAPVPCTGRCAG